jgi:hypothetical protein
MISLFFNIFNAKYIGLPEEETAPAGTGTADTATAVDDVAGVVVAADGCV